MGAYEFYLMIMTGKAINTYTCITAIHLNNCIGTPDPSTAVATTVMLRTALVVVTCVLGVMSALMFVIGFVCGHCFSQRKRKSAGKNNESPLDSTPTTEAREDLELKENVAYITIHPK